VLSWLSTGTTLLLKVKRLFRNVLFNAAVFKISVSTQNYHNYFYLLRNISVIILWLSITAKIINAIEMGGHPTVSKVLPSVGPKQFFIKLILNESKASSNI
jgi:hypothetical protein